MVELAKLLAVASAVAACDFAWVIYVKAIDANRTRIAALTGAAIHLLNALVTIEYVDNKAALVAIMVGGFVGTVIAMRFDGKEKTMSWEARKREEPKEAMRTAKRAVLRDWCLEASSDLTRARLEIPELTEQIKQAETAIADLFRASDT